MDAFKLLTRSIKLKGSQLGSSSISSHLPSAGEANNPQLFPASEADKTRGTKRKRESGEDTELPNEIPVPDFFGSGSTAAESPKAQRKRVTGKDADAEGQHGEETSMPEEERKSILKSHKIKMTDLRTPPFRAVDTDISGKKSKRKKKKVEEPPPLTRKQLKAAQRLYPEPLTSFDKLRTRYHISRRLSDNIASQGYTVPTEVQLGSLPLLLGNAPAPNERTADDESLRSQSEREPDLLVVAPTGSGKTLSFMIPLINKIMKHHHDNPGLKEILAIVVAPTKELVAQIVNEGRKLTAGTGVKVSAVRKGMRIVEERGQEKRSLEEENDGDDSTASSDEEIHSSEGEKSKDIPLTKSDILVCTPLVLANALSDGGKRDVAPLPSVQKLVLEKPMSFLTLYFGSRLSLRVGLWSATMGSNIEELTNSTIKERQELLGLKDESSLIRLVVGLKDTAIPNISHKLVYAATEQGKLLGLRQLLHPTSTSSSTTHLRPPFLIFTQTIARAIALHSELMYDIPAEAGGSSRIAVLHSELSDSKRSDVMAGFRKGEIWVLITTDLLARGVDFRGINGVVNYDIPNSSASYVHRVGNNGVGGGAVEGGVAKYCKCDIPQARTYVAQKKGERIPKWLLDALPSLSKNDKKDLKKYGVKARRPSTISDKTTSKKTRISTKSGFDRRMDNKRKGAIKGSQRRKAREQLNDEESEDDVWNGIDD
ncbi:ATP-dependent RNA helicase rok1 [Coccidioides immitis RMSCC 3703]|uniref:ATP-dependent RNA helicase n=1 Tax=Coccidioides immitis RMSCC 3703 TaxID=454286 RepID=A0A0J8QYS0_COCIT|nr:ATP-dependent RNA helicase rok1 [Coccidioides immitis RMSCC 3703]